ncbi:MAG: TA system VapC family ribonuclease toxin [Sphingomonas sp.]
MSYLLDVNVLIALIDRDHFYHDLAHQWFQREGRRSWATCPITINGVLRIVGHPGYPASPGSPGTTVRPLQRLLALPGHEAWDDDISLLDERLIDHTLLLKPSQVTDSYLLALAVSRGGKLATFDRRLVAAIVRGGTGALYYIPDHAAQ